MSDRFVEVYSQGVTNIRKVFVDTETGVNYLLASSNMTSGCGVSVMLNADGTPLVTHLGENAPVAMGQLLDR